MKFLEPSINFIGDSGNGKAVGEFPILYYIVALLWKIFGKHEFIFRLLNFTIAFLGLLYLFKLLTLIIKNNFWAIVITLTLFTSPIYAYYANNFLPNVPALSLVFIGWYFFYKFYISEKNKYLYITMFFFLLAGLLKISSMISFFTILILYLIELPGIIKFKEKKKIFDKPILNIIPFVIVIIVLFAWNIFAIQYNKINNDGLFRQGVSPIWTLKPEEIKIILTGLAKNILPEFFNKFLLFLSLIVFILLIISVKKINKLLLLILISFFGATLCYMTLFFKVFDVHDYYLIDILILPIAVFSIFIILLKNNYHRLFNSKLLKTAFAILLSYSIYYCSIHTRIKYDAKDKWVKSSLFMFDQKQMEYWDWFHWHYENTVQGCETITPYLRSLGIQRSDKVISIPDRSPNISLYYMNQIGNTDIFFEPVDGEKNIRNYIKNGAKYLILNDKSYLEKDYIKPFVKDQIGEYKNVAIYDLRNITL